MKEGRENWLVLVSSSPLESTQLLWITLEMGVTGTLASELTEDLNVSEYLNSKAAWNPDS